ncbi:MAG: transcriptional repressor NrdR [Spirochaetaceae bacterium]|nr:MAG: transcriptional repressor NrdR [Spirochaetaceae bacterium]
MRCPHCQEMEDKVIESRTLADGTAIRRRRECLSCGYRYTSYERVEERPLMVIKTTGAREPFDRNKLERGVVQAVRKRPISQLQIEEIINGVEDRATVLAKTTHEIASHQLGEMLLEALYDLDRVAYVRFASVYRNFTNVEEFVQEIERLKKANLARE